MNILNPNKYVRIGLISAIEIRIPDVPVWYKKVPLNELPIPLKYILLDSQTKIQTVVSKSTTEKGVNFEWLTTIDINIYSLKDFGFSDADDVDDIEQEILSIVTTGFTIPNFDTKDVRIIESQDLSTETQTNSIDRKLLKIEIWLNNNFT